MPAGSGSRQGPRRRERIVALVSQKRVEVIVREVVSAASVGLVGQAPRRLDAPKHALSVHLDGARGQRSAPPARLRVAVLEVMTRSPRALAALVDGLDHVDVIMLRERQPTYVVPNLDGGHEGRNRHLRDSGSRSGDAEERWTDYCCSPFALGLGLPGALSCLRSGRKCADGPVREDTRVTASAVTPLPVVANVVLAFKRPGGRRSAGDDRGLLCCRQLGGSGNNRFAEDLLALTFALARGRGGGGVNGRPRHSRRRGLRRGWRGCRVVLLDLGLRDGRGGVRVLARAPKPAFAAVAKHAAYFSRLLGDVGSGRSGSTSLEGLDERDAVGRGAMSL